MGISDNAIVNNAAEVARIENRLKEIGGYKFLPPSIKEEKEKLAARLIELKALTHQMENENKTSLQEAEDQRPKAGTDEKSQQQITDMPKAEGLRPEANGGGQDTGQAKPVQDTTNPFANAKDSGSPPGTLKLPEEAAGSNQAANPFGSTPAQAAVLSDLEEKEKTEKKGDEAPATGWNGAYGTIGQRDALDDIDINIDINKEYNPDRRTQSIEHEIEKKEETRTEDRKPELKHIASVKADRIIDEAKDVIKSFEKALGEAKDNLDVGYLADVLKEFEGLVKHLEGRAGKVEMSVEQKNRAVRGRLKSYIGEIKAEFEFSNLLSADLERKIKELVQ